MTSAELDSATPDLQDLAHVVVCTVGELPRGTMRAIRLPGLPPLAAYNVDGDVYVTADTCTHAQAFLSDGDLEEDRVVCPAHWAEFDVRTGEALCFPATNPVAVFPALVEGDQIIADLSQNDKGVK